MRHPSAERVLSGLLVLNTAILAACGLAIADSQRTKKSPLTAAANYSALDCDGFAPVYSRIQLDVAVHKQHGGVTLESTRHAAGRWGTPGLRGQTVGFFGGVAYLLVPTDWEALHHHGPLHLSYMRSLLHVQRTFGAAVPDAAFVLTTSDTPRHPPPPPLAAPAARARDPTQGPFPIFCFCKSDLHSDILLVPNVHFR